MGGWTYFPDSKLIVSMVVISMNAMWALYLLTIVLSSNPLINRLLQWLSSFGVCQRIRSGIITREVEMP